MDFWIAAGRGIRVYGLGAISASGVGKREGLVRRSSENSNAASVADKEAGGASRPWEGINSKNYLSKGFRKVEALQNVVAVQKADLAPVRDAIWAFVELEMEHMREALREKVPQNVTAGENRRIESATQLMVTHQVENRSRDTTRQLITAIGEQRRSVV